MLARRDLRTFGIRLSASRDSMAFDARGVGMGAANLSLILRRGRAADTLFFRGLAGFDTDPRLLVRAPASPK